MENKTPLTFNEIPAGISEILSRMEMLEKSLQQLIGDKPKQKGEKLITRKEAADILHISLPTLPSWTLDGKISGYRIGRRVLYKKNEIEQAIKVLPTNPKNITYE